MRWNIVKYCELLLSYGQSLPTFVHFLRHEWKKSKFSQYLTVFPIHFINIYLKSFGLLQIFNERLWDFARLYKFDCKILVWFRQFGNFEVSNLPFVKVQKVADTHSSLDVRWHRKKVITLTPAGRRASGRKRSARQIRTRPHRPHQLHRQVSRRHFAGFQPSSCSGQSRPHTATRGLFLFLDLNVRLSLLSLYTTVVCVACYNPEATLPYFTVDVFGCTCISSWDSSTTNVFYNCLKEPR